MRNFGRRRHPSGQGRIYMMMTATKGFGHQPLLAIQYLFISVKLGLRRQCIQKTDAAVITGGNCQMGGLKRQCFPIDIGSML